MKKNLEETHRLQLAAISVIALCNTEDSLKKQGLEKDNPYWSVAFEDVRTAMRREIKLINGLKEMELRAKNSEHNFDLVFEENQKLQVIL